MGLVRGSSQGFEYWEEDDMARREEWKRATGVRSRGRRRVGRSCSAKMVAGEEAIDGAEGEVLRAAVGRSSRLTPLTP